MRKAIESAANWLAAHSKHNPIPYPLFKSIITKQIEWAGKKGVSLDFAKLGEAVRAELQKSGIRVTSEGNESRSKPLFEDTDAEARGGEPLPPLLIKFKSTGEAASMMVIFEWLRKVFNTAGSRGAIGVELSAVMKEEQR